MMMQRLAIRAFDRRQADFSGMTGEPSLQAPIAIGSIGHRDALDVTEDGTEAAAATAATAGAILFHGRIVDPR